VVKEAAYIVLACTGAICERSRMAILKVAHLGHPILRQVAAPVPPEAIGAPEIQRLIDDMLETMAEHDGAGLAAPQVHVSRRVVIYGVEANPRYPDAEPVPLTVLVNPTVTPLTRDEEEDWEGCLSVPDLRGMVPRPTRVEVSGWGRDGRMVRFTAGGFHARVVQHECDHLDGVVYLDRMRSLATLSYLPEFHRHWGGRKPAEK
jgi:peptide deformylase